MMAEILEKGLLIGFGLSIALLFFGIFTPYLSIIFTGTQESLDQHDTFVYSIEYGLSYNQYEDELHINMSLTIEIQLFLNFKNNIYFLNISSPLKSTLLSSTSLIILSNNSVTGNFEVIFSYDVNLVIISFRGEQ